MPSREPRLTAECVTKAVAMHKYMSQPSGGNVGSVDLIQVEENQKRNGFKVWTAWLPKDIRNELNEWLNCIKII